MPVSLKRLKFIADKWSSLDPSIKSWESLTDAERAGILNFIALKPGELPLAVLPDAPNPLMLSSYRLVWTSGGQVTELDLNHISRVQPPKDWNHDKLSLHTVKIESSDHRQHALELPAGKTCFSVWNLILRFMGNGFAGRGTQTAREKAPGLSNRRAGRDPSLRSGN